MELSLTLETAQPLIVLLVEDCLEDREIIKRYLLAQKKKYTIVEASEVEEALELYQRYQPDIVLLDYHLPDSDGLEFLEQIHQKESENYCPVILLTGQGSEKLAVQAMKAGVCDYLVKGQLTPQELRMVVNSAIEKARLRAQLRQERAERHRQIEQEKLIAQIANQIHSRLDIDEILDATVSEVRQFLKCDRVLIFRFQPDKSRVVVAESVDDGLLSILNAQVKDADFMQTRFEEYQQGRIRTIADIYAANLSECHLKILEQFQIRAKLAVPILQKDSLWGLLVANQCSGPRQWQTQDIELLKQLTTQVGIAIAQAELIERVQIELSDRKRAQKALEQSERDLRESEEYLRMGMQIAGFALAKFDYTSDTVELSSEAAALYGLPVSELVIPRSRIHATFHPEDREKLALSIEHLIDPTGSGWFVCDHRIVLGNGEVRWLTVRKQVFFDLSGQTPRPRFSILAAIDISDRKRVEEDLRQSEEFARSIFNSSADCIKVLDTEGHLISMNVPGMCLMEIEDFSSFVGKNWTAFWQDETRKAAQDAIAAAKANGIGRFQGFCPTAKGKPKWWDIIVTPVTDAQDKVIRLVSTSRDITARKQAEQQLQQQAQKLRQLNAALEKTTSELTERNQELDRFTYTVSHDLKAPLRAISNLSQWIEDDLEGQLNDENHHQMELLRNRVARMEALINGLLDYSRIGRTKVATERVNVGELLAEVIDSLAPPATFTISVRSQMPTIITKPLLLSQVFSNLISNAIKHHPRLDGRIEIKAIQKEKFVEFFVTDDGSGIAPENQEKIFGIFQTLKARDVQENTGIGLSIVKKIIETEGGNIALESDLGCGSTFRFTLPFFSDQ
jgi:PAS domain S-box-containing protein